MLLKYILASPMEHDEHQYIYSLQWYLGGVGQY